MLVERDHECALLHDAVAGLRDTGSRVVAITGGLGAGKSALLAEAATLAGEARIPVVAGAAARGGQDLPFSMARQFGPCLNSCGAGPLVLTIDDLQWADDASLAWLAHLPATVTALVVVAVLAGDPGGERAGVRALLDRADQTIRPAPLSAAGVERLLAAAHPPSAARLAARVHRLTGGNPLLVTAVAGDTTLRQHATGTVLPGIAGAQYGPLRQRVTAALATLPAPVRDYAWHAALLGRDAQAPLVGQVAGLDEAVTRVAERVLREMGLIAPQPAQPLLDAVLRHVVDTTMPPASFADAHQRAARLLHAAGAPAATVAEHLAQAGTPDQPALIPVLRDAANAALARHDLPSTARYLRVALRTRSISPADRGRLTVELAATEWCRDPATARRLVMQALPRLPDDAERAAALVRLAPAALLGDASAVGETIQDLLGRLRAHSPGCPPALAEQLEARMWIAGWREPATLSAAATRLSAIGPRPDTAVHRDLAGVLLFAATISAQASARELAPLAERLLAGIPADHAAIVSVAPLVVASAVATGGVPALPGWLAQAQQAVERASCPLAAAQIHAQRAFLELHTGHPHRAAGHALTALALRPDGFGDDQLSIAMLAGVAAMVPDARLRRLAAAHSTLGRATETDLLPLVHRLLYAATVYRREPELALAALTECERQLVAHGWRNRVFFPTGVLVAPLLHRLGRTGAALARIEEEYRLAAAWGATTAAGRALRVWGELSRGRHGRRLLDEAVEVLERSGNQLELARALVARGTRLLASGERTGRNDLRRGRRLAQAAGVTRLADLACLALETHVEQVVPAIASLTPRERRVAELVAAGRTNRAVAEYLGITQRAVEKHITNCYRKMNISNRSELKAAFGAFTDYECPIHVSGCPRPATVAFPDDPEQRT